MRWKRVTGAALALFAAAAMAGCVTEATYEQKTKHLDAMTQAGITYRNDLLRQGTEISEAACQTGWDLLDPSFPDDTGAGVSRRFRDQSKEAYMKGCLTGEERPKPEPSGVKAVTPVPHGSASGDVAGSPSGGPPS